MVMVGFNIDRLQKYVEKVLPLKTTTFNCFGRTILVVFFIIAITVISISTGLRSSATLQCLYDEEISETKNVALTKYINAKCYHKYQDEFHSILPMNVMFTLNFGIVLISSIIYTILVRHRVEKFDYPTGTEAAAPPSIGLRKPRELRKCFSHFSTFFIYVLHLFVFRIIPLLVFACVFYLTHIPNNFSCPWQSDIQLEGKSTSSFNDRINERSNFTIIHCTNPTGAKSKTLVDVVTTVDVIFVILAILELGYIGWLTFNDRNFMTDQEFCTVYLLRKRKRIRKLVNEVRERFNPEIFQLNDDFGGDDTCLESLEEIYVNVVIQEGRERLDAYPRKFERHEIYQAHLETPSTVTKLESTSDIFKPKKGEQNQTYPLTILVIGRPGIGKTMLTRKLLHQWKVQEDEFWHEKIVILLQFRTFINKTVTLREMLSSSDGLSIDETVYNSILSNPTNTILIFDGLDELSIYSKSLSEIKKTVRCPFEKMPILSICSMLVHGRLLPGVTVLITSRPTAQHLFATLNFQRTVEILGFFEEEIKEYVFKFCPNDVGTSELIWNQLKESVELLSLCYVPVNSYIVCLTLKECIESGQEIGDINSHRKIPKTMTELYKRAIKVLLYRHHPKYKLLEQRPSDYLITRFPAELEGDLSKLKDVAKNGISEERLIFERTTDDEFSELANCGLFHKLPDNLHNFFCFLHLTLQEFLAASHVVDDMENVEKFLVTHVDDPKWHLVIQFVAGLVGDKIRETKMVKPDQTEIIDDILKRFKEWVILLGVGSKENNIALVGIKCLYELQDIDIMKSVSNKFVEEKHGNVCLKDLSVTRPTDSTALFEFLSSNESLKRLQFSHCKPQDLHRLPQNI